MTTIQVGPVTETYFDGRVSTTTSDSSKLYNYLKVVEENTQDLFNKETVSIAVKYIGDKSKESLEEYAAGVLKFAKDLNTKANLIRILTSSEEEERIITLFLKNSD